MDTENALYLLFFFKVDHTNSIIRSQALVDWFLIFINTYQSVTTGYTLILIS